MSYIHAPGCGGYQHGMWTAPAACGRPVVAAGPVFYPYPHPQTWLGFACAEHVGLLEVARPLTDSDRAVLARRSARHHEHRPNPGPVPEEVPLATGRAARELIARARRWPPPTRTRPTRRPPTHQPRRPSRRRHDPARSPGNRVDTETSRPAGFWTTEVVEAGGQQGR